MPLAIGLLFGFFGSTPIAGPTAALVVSRALQKRGAAGIYVALGSAVAETLYAFMAVWGLATMIARFPALLFVSRLLGCAALVGLGVYLVVHPVRPHAEARQNGIPTARRRNMALGFTITIANPTLIVTWTAAVGLAHSIGLRMRAGDALPFALGAGAGAVTWFALLVWLIGHARSRMDALTSERVIRGFGVLLVAIALALALRVLTLSPGS